MAINKLFSVGMIRNPDIEVSKRMEMEVIPHEDKTFHYKFTKGHDKLNCIFGEYRTNTFNSIRELGETIQNECLPNDVFVSGLAGYDKVEVLTPSSIQKRQALGTIPEEYIQRTKANFNWSNTPGLLAIDIDAQKDGRYSSVEEVIDILQKLFPKAPMLIKGSTSSHVYYSGEREVRDSKDNVIVPDRSNETNIEAIDLTKKKGLRVYIVISSLSWLHKAKDWLEVKFWNLGTGFIDYSANGNELRRCLIDLAMYSSTDRADFIKASLTKDVVDKDNNVVFYQDFGEFTYINENEPPFDIRKLKDITEEEKSWYMSFVNKERENPENIQRKKDIQKQYFKDKQEQAINNAKDLKGSNLTEEEKKKIDTKVHNSIRKLIENKELDELHPLYVYNEKDKSVDIVTTLDIFKDENSAKKYHGMSCASVLDPFYTPGKVYTGLDTMNIFVNSANVDFTKAKILSCNEPPSIMDQAHGGTRFFFDTEFFDIKRIEIERTDTSPTILPSWNFTEIANCFLNQWNKENTDNIDNFGNVLLNLYKEDSSIGLNYKILDEISFKVFCLTLDLSEVKGLPIWNNLTGYGPSLFDFMNYNSSKKVNVSLKDNDILEGVNKLDVKMRYNIVNSGFYKSKGNRLESIVSEKIHNKDFGWIYKLGTPGSLSDFYQEDCYYYDKKGETVLKHIVDMWISSRFKTRYSGGMEFLPVSGLIATKNSEMVSSGKYIFNLYTGLNMVPKPSMKTHIEYEQDDKFYDIVDESGNKKEKYKKYVKSWYLIDEHIKNVLCAGDMEKYEYMLNWIANMFQHPYRSGETLLAFQGEEGIGKNQFWDMIIRAFGSFATILTDPSALTGNFNSGVAEKILVVLNEAFWEGDKKGHSILKGFVTDEFVLSKKKHVDDILVKNTSHLVIMTNHEAVAPMGIGDRRIVTFDVSNKYARNREYFGKMISEINSGGAESFVYDMLKRDLSEFNISMIPNSVHSDSAINSVMNTAEPWLRWLYECLLDDEIKGLNVGIVGHNIIGKWQSSEGADSGLDNICIVNKGWIPNKVLFDSYNQWKEESKIRGGNLTSNMFTRNVMRFLMKGVGSEVKVSDVKKKVRFDKYSSVNSLKIEGLEHSRETLIKYINKVILWDEMENEDIRSEEEKRKDGK